MYLYFFKKIFVQKDTSAELHFCQTSRELRLINILSLKFKLDFWDKVNMLYRDNKNVLLLGREEKAGGGKLKNESYENYKSIIDREVATPEYFETLRKELLDAWGYKGRKKKNVNYNDVMKDRERQQRIKNKEVFERCLKEAKDFATSCA